MSTPAEARAGVTRGDIRVLVAAFYTRVRAEPRLGPIFHAHVGTEDADWAPHLTKIEDFWANVMLHDRVYQGNPMQVHRRIAEIEPADFECWLALFEATAHDVLPAGKADVFAELARRIGRSLAMGIERVRSDGPPLFAPGS